MTAYVIDHDSRFMPPPVSFAVIHMIAGLPEFISQIYLAICLGSMVPARRAWRVSPVGVYRAKRSNHVALDKARRVSIQRIVFRLKTVSPRRPSCLAKPRVI